MHLGLRAQRDLGEQVPEPAEHRDQDALAGRTSDTIAASIPARDVPSTSRVASLVVAKTSRYSAIVSFM